MNLAIGLAAARYGAALANYTEVVHLLKTTDPESGREKVCGARCRDVITGSSPPPAVHPPPPDPSSLSSSSPIPLPLSLASLPPVFLQLLLVLLLLLFLLFFILLHFLLLPPTSPLPSLSLSPPPLPSFPPPYPTFVPPPPPFPPPSPLLHTLTGNEFDVWAKCVINATGPFTDSLRKMDNQETANICQPSAGVHIVIPGYFR